MNPYILLGAGIAYVAVAIGSFFYGEHVSNLACAAAQVVQVVQTNTDNVAVIGHVIEEHHAGEAVAGKVAETAEKDRKKFSDTRRKVANAPTTTCQIPAAITDSLSLYAPADGDKAEGGQDGGSGIASDMRNGTGGTKP